MHYLTHDFGPDPARPGCTRCLWCGEPFERAGGTMCQVDPAARAAAHSATDELPIVEQPRPPRPWSLWAAAALLTIVVIALGTALGWMLVTGSYDVPYDPGPAATP